MNAQVDVVRFDFVSFPVPLHSAVDTVDCVRGENGEHRWVLRAADGAVVARWESTSDLVVELLRAKNLLGHELTEEPKQVAVSSNGIAFAGWVRNRWWAGVRSGPDAPWVRQGAYFRSGHHADAWARDQLAALSFDYVHRMNALADRCGQLQFERDDAIRRANAAEAELHRLSRKRG